MGTTVPKKREERDLARLEEVDTCESVSWRVPRRQSFTFDVSGYERLLIADESECPRGVWHN